MKNTRSSWDKMQLQCVDQQEGLLNQGDPTRDKSRHRGRQMLWDSATEENRTVIIQGKREIWELLSPVFIAAKIQCHIYY